MQIHFIVAAVTEDNSRECDFIGGNIQVGHGPYSGIVHFRR